MKTRRSCCGRRRRGGPAKPAAEARAALVKLDGGNGPAVLLCDAHASKGADPSMTERVAAVFGSTPNRADACLALASLRAAAGDEADAARLTERAFALEPT